MTLTIRVPAAFFILFALSPLQPTRAAEVLFDGEIETVTGDAGDVSSCGLAIGDPASFVVEFDDAAGADATDVDFAIFSDDVQQIRFALKDYSGVQSDFSQNTIGITDQTAVGGELQFANLRLTENGTVFEFDATFFHRPPPSLVSDVADFETFAALIESFNDDMTIEFWFHCERDGNVPTFVTVNNVAVPEPRFGMASAFAVFVWMFVSNTRKRCEKRLGCSQRPSVASS